MAGLLDIAQNPLINFGMGLLNGGGPNNPNQWGAGAQNGLLNMQNAAQIQQRQQALAQQQDYREQQMEMQRAQALRQQQEYDAAQAQQAKLLEYRGSLPPEEHPSFDANPSNYVKQAQERKFATNAAGTSAMQNAAAIGLAPGSPEYEQFIREVTAKGGGSLPAILQEWIAFQAMTPENKEMFLTMKRANPAINLGGSIVRAGQADPRATLDERTVTLKPGETPAVRQQQAAASAIGAAAGEAQSQLPGASLSVDRVTKQISALKAHPGKADAVGGIWDSNTPAMPGSPKADFLSRLEQIHGGAFLEARQALKGGGSISDGESARAEAAYARMSRSLSEKDFDKALDEFQSAVEDGYKALQGTAGANLKEGGLTPSEQAELQELRARIGR